MRLFPTPRYQDERELLDDLEGISGDALESTLRDIRRANIFGLGTWVIEHHLARLLGDLSPGQPVRLLDLATGSADIPEQVCRWATRRGIDLSVVATDISEPILRVARRRINKAGFADKVSFVLCDAVQPPFADGAFDVVTCSLAFHHFNLQQAQTALSQMSRLARRAFIVNDIYRSHGAWLMARFLAHSTTLNSLTRHDGPASVLRAFTPAEMVRLLKNARVDAGIYTHPFWRMAIVGKPEYGVPSGAREAQEPTRE
jgi:SAM-dependent methyltransferase